MTFHARIEPRVSICPGSFHKCSSFPFPFLGACLDLCLLAGRSFIHLQDFHISHTGQLAI